MMQQRILSRSLALILIFSLVCSMFYLPAPALAADGQTQYIAYYGINAHWVEKDGLKDQYAEMDLFVQLPFLRDVKEPIDVLFIADVSSSMDEPVKGEYPSMGHYDTLAPLAAIKDGMDLCAGFLSDSDTDDRFGLISFSDEVNVSYDFTDDAATFKREVLHLSTKESGTNYCAALTAAKEMLAGRADKSRPAYVVFMTDSEPDIWRAQAANAITELAAEADIYAVQLGCTVNILSGATKTYRADTTEEMLNAVPFALSDLAQCGKWSQVNMTIPISSDFVMGQASPAETYGTAVIDASGLKYTATDVPSGVTYALHYPLTLTDPDTLKTELTVNPGGTFSLTAPGEAPSPATAFPVRTLDRPRYTVTYDGNGSTSGAVPVDNNRYAPGTSVEYPDAGDLKKEVDGKVYQFQGWRVKQGSNSYDYGSHFNIYGNTVIEATWTTASVAKTSTTKGDIKEPVLMSFVEPASTSSGIAEVKEAFHSNTYKRGIVSATFLDKIEIPTTATDSWDVSAAQDGSVMAWVTPGTTAYTYDLFIAGNGGVIANPDSSYLFGCVPNWYFGRTSIDPGNDGDPFTRLERVSGLENLDTSRVTNMFGMFRHCQNLKSVDLSSLDTSKVTNMAELFFDCRALTNAPAMPTDFSSLTTAKSMFSGCSSLTDFPQLPTNTGNVTDMSRMFENCSALTEADISVWDTGNVTDMNHMFYCCFELTKIPTPPADTGKLTNMSYMFANCYNITDADFTGWDTHNVTDMSSLLCMVGNSKLTSFDFSSLDTSNVTDMNSLFYGAKNFSSLDLSDLDTSNVENMSYMFYQCTGLTSLPIIPSIASVTEMRGMFYSCTALTTIDISGWDISRVTDVTNMFYNCTNLTSIGTTTLTVAQNCISYNFQNGTALPTTITINCTGAAPRAAAAALSDEEVQTDIEPMNFLDEEAPADIEPMAFVDEEAPTRASMAAKTSRAASAPTIIDKGRINAGDEINYQITVLYEGDSGCYSGDIQITDPLPDGLTVKPDSIAITATRIDPSDGIRASYLVKQTPQVNDGVLSLCLTGIATGSQVVISYTCTTPASIAPLDYKQFLNSAVMTIDGRTYYTDTIRHWIGADPVELRKVFYMYGGDVPDNAPTPPNIMEYAPGETVIVAPAPAVPGYTFSGWQGGGISGAASFTMPDSDVEFFGTWTKDPDNVPKTVNVKYEYRGDVPAGVPALPAERSHKVNSFAIVAAKPSSDDYTFDGWHCDDTDKVSAQDLADGRFYVGETETVLYGSWSPKTYTVSYEYTGTVPAGVPALPASQSYAWGTQVTGAAAPADTAEYAFSGWITTASLDAAAPYASFTMPKENVVFRGSWSKRTYSVKYVYTGTVPEGAQALLPAADAFYPGDTVTVAAAPTLDGRKFSGWSVQSGLTDGAITAGSFTMPAGEVILQGSWSKSGGGSSGGGSSRPSQPTKTPAALNTEEHTNYIIGRDGGYMKPLAKINRAETATIFFRLLTEEYRDEVWAESCGYPDVRSTAWHNRAVSTLTNAGILNGYPDGTFRPDAPITRAEFAAIAARFDSTPYDGEDLFPDVAGHWAADAIYRAAQKGWIKGYPDGTFHPDQDITRAEAITLINRVLGRDGEALGDPVKDAIKWRDVAADDWYYDAIREATNSHSYQRVDDGEQWLAIADPTDWHRIEDSRGQAAK